MTDTTLMTVTDIARYMQRSRQYIYSTVITQPDFPKPLRLRSRSGSQGRPRWNRGDVETWVKARST